MSRIARPAAVSYSNWKPLPLVSSRCRLMTQPLVNRLCRWMPTLPLPEKLSAKTPMGNGCHSSYTRTDLSVYPTTSKFTSADLQNYGYRPRGLTDAQYDALKTQAQAQAIVSAILGGSAAAASSGKYGNAQVCTTS